jgi:hypothetical protein
MTYSGTSTRADKINVVETRALRQTCPFHCISYTIQITRHFDIFSIYIFYIFRYEYTCTQIIKTTNNLTHLYLYLILKQGRFLTFFVRPDRWDPPVRDSLSPPLIPAMFLACATPSSFPSSTSMTTGGADNIGILGPWSNLYIFRIRIKKKRNTMPTRI